MTNTVTISVYNEQLEDGGFEVGCYVFNSYAEEQRIIQDSLTSYREHGEVIAEVQSGTTVTTWKLDSDGDPDIVYSTKWRYQRESFGCE